MSPLLYQQYASQIEDNELLTRKEFAERVGRKKTTCFIQHLERAVSEGLLHKAWFSLGNNTGWCYARPDTMPKFL